MPGKPHKTVYVENEHFVVKLLKWLPKGLTDTGGYRERDLVQFIAKDGGTRTTYASNLTVL